MAESNWTFLSDGLDSATVKRGVTYGLSRPNGGGDFCFGFASKAVTPGAVGLFANQVNFAPMAKGGSVRGALCRRTSGGPLNFATFLFIGLGGSSVTNYGYLLGLSDDEPHHIQLRKGKLSDGLPSEAPSPPLTASLRRSTETFDPETWLHLRLDMIVETNGDVLLQCKRSDLALHSVLAPSWEDIPGMSQFIDDVLGVNSGTMPYVSGRVGYGFQSKDVTRVTTADHIEVLRQL